MRATWYTSLLGGILAGEIYALPIFSEIFEDVDLKNYIIAVIGFFAVVGWYEWSEILRLKEIRRESEEPEKWTRIMTRNFVDPLVRRILIFVPTCFITWLVCAPFFN